MDLKKITTLKLTYGAFSFSLFWHPLVHKGEKYLPSVYCQKAHLVWKLYQKSLNRAFHLLLMLVWYLRGIKMTAFKVKVTLYS